MQDYSGNEYYDAIYGMIDLNIGQKINVLTGVRNETNKTIYNSFHGIVGPRSNSYTAGADTVSSYTRTNSSLLPSIFIKCSSNSFLDRFFLFYLGCRICISP